MSLYNISLSIILLFANWLFISSYVNINKFFSYNSNNPQKSNIILSILDTLGKVNPIPVTG